MRPTMAALITVAYRKVDGCGKKAWGLVQAYSYGSEYTQSIHLSLDASYSSYS